MRQCLQNMIAGLLTTIITLLVLQKAQPQGPVMEDEVSTQSKYMPAEISKWKYTTSIYKWTTND